MRRFRGTLGAMFSPRTLEFVMVSFEGPDQYSLAGGLGVRARELTRALADAGYRAHLVFVGDPSAPEREKKDGVNLIRWCQSQSNHAPAGVYEGERSKIQELAATLPATLISEIIAPAAEEGRVVAVLCEEWHTVEFCIRLSDALHAANLRHNCVLLWNANNHFGFDEINWQALNYVASITTVSRYMKHLMWPHGVNPVVIPNGIPHGALSAPDAGNVHAIRTACESQCLAFKIGRFTPDKRWNQAVDAIAELRAEGMPSRLLVRGGIEAHGAEVIHRARQRGLSICEWYEPVADASGVVRALEESNGAEIVNICRFMPESVLPEIEAAVTAVLANSGHEPFGLVGLETMAAGGVALVGPTGEEYARSYGNAIVIETDDGAEVASALRGLVERPAIAKRLRRAARRDAADFAWPSVIEGLLERLRYMALHQHVLLSSRQLVQK